jgi:hypothetical protein
MADNVVHQTERVRDHVRRILNHHTTPTEAAVTDPVPGTGLQEIAVEIQLKTRNPMDATRACRKAAIAICARPSSEGCGSMTIFDPKTGQTITIEPKPRTET